MNQHVCDRCGAVKKQEKMGELPSGFLVGPSVGRLMSVCGTCQKRYTEMHKSAMEAMWADFCNRKADATVRPMPKARTEVDVAEAARRQETARLVSERLRADPTLMAKLVPGQRAVELLAMLTGNRKLKNEETAVANPPDPKKD